ncbi:ThuA domain-containing protein [Brevifollis gellanilyticus]|uniref:Trehalose utilization protein ThuA n=1 Tax=Brevifollis gellanilyticus TaxID=748831 RepID=A0A512MFP8_9BACT|nr:ThuA domain-containing protein [Brevifollis gellanilyticus]GEP45559.1 trehalose utilization protein ThuA [Brevifollis gellanilyticus]
MSSLAPIRITIWNEFVHERQNDVVAGIYPKGIHGALADALSIHADFSIRTATLDEPEQGLPQSILDETDVLLWWGHKAHEEVHDEIVTRVQQRVLAGMGLIVLHSGHFSKVFKRLMGTSCALCWREAGERERVWVVNPGHPIATGLGDCIEIEHSEMYGEPFGIPTPDELIFVSWFQGGEVFRSGATWKRGSGRIFYFSPGHEVYPIYHHPDIQRVIANGIRWARPQGVAARTPRHVPVDQAREVIASQGGTVH